MTRAIVGGSLVLLALTACVDARRASPLTLPEGMQSLIVAVEGDRELELTAAPVSEPPAIAWSTALTVLLAYAEPLSVLQIAEGPLTPALSKPNRDLPEASFIATWDDDLGEWRPLSEPPDAIARFKLPAYDPASCARAGGCFGEAPETICKSSCVVNPWTGMPADPALPDPPEDPRLGSDGCPPRWAVEAIDTLLVCAPVELRTSAACAVHQAQGLRDLECRTVGATCPVGDWPAPENIPADRPVIHVRPEAAPGGSGTPEQPFRTVAEALAADPRRPIALALSKGRFVEQVVLRDDVALIGACTRETSLVATSSTTRAISVEGARASLRDLRIEGGETAVVVHQLGASLALSGVVIAAGPGRGIIQEPGTSLEADDLVIRDRNQALYVNAADARLRRAVLDTNTEAGLFANVNGTASLSLSDVVIRGTQDGHAISLQDGARVEIDGALIEDTVGVAASVRGRGTALRAKDLHIRRVRAVPDGSLGTGLEVTNGAALELEDCSLDAMEGFGVRLHDLGTTATIARAVIRDTGANAIEIAHSVGARVSKLVVQRARRLIDVHPGSVLLLEDALTATTGSGITAWDGARIEAHRVRLAHVELVGLSAHEGARISAFDLSIHDVARPSNAPTAFGILLGNRTRSRLERARLERAGANTVKVLTAATATITDLDVISEATEEDYAPARRDERAHCVLTEGAAHARISRARLVACADVGLATGGTPVHIEDLTISRVKGLHGNLKPIGLTVSGTGAHDVHATVSRVRVSDFTGEGIGAHARAGLTLSDARVTGPGETGLILPADATVTADRLLIEDVAGSGLIARGAEMTRRFLDLTDVAVIRAGRDTGRGTGVLLRNHSTALISRFLVRDTSGAALDIGGLDQREPPPALSDGLITGNKIGAKVRDVLTEGTEVLRRVRYEDNETIFSADH